MPDPLHRLIHCNRGAALPGRRRAAVRNIEATLCDRHPDPPGALVNHRPQVVHFVRFSGAAPFPGTALSDRMAQPGSPIAVSGHTAPDLFSGRMNAIRRRIGIPLINNDDSANAYRTRTLIPDERRDLPPSCMRRPQKGQPDDTRHLARSLAPSRTSNTPPHTECRPTASPAHPAQVATI